jgi:hypothetical protein
MSESPERAGANAVIRWGAALTAVLFAAASVSFHLEGASAEPVAITAALSVGFGIFAWNEWRRG